MLAQVRSAYVHGIEAFSVVAEVDVATGLPGFHLVGLGQAAVKEAGVRVRAALRQAGWKLPPRRVTVNLAPADIRKEGTALDLPIAIGVLAAHGEVPIDAVAKTLFLGELVSCFGPKAASPTLYSETDWRAERWSLGGMISHFAPGALTVFGNALHEPAGRIHWAGSERATEMHGL